MDQLTLRPVPEGKRCASCGEFKPRTDFRTARKEKDGLQHRCRACWDAAWARRNFPRRTEGTKFCTACARDLSVAAFSKSRHKSDGLGSLCKECAKWKSRERLYGITRDEFERRLTAQDNRCGICRTDSPILSQRHPDGWCLDHDHQTGRVRGILCLQCNLALAAMERPGFAEGAGNYLRRHSTE